VASGDRALNQRSSAVICGSKFLFAFTSTENHHSAGAWHGGYTALHQSDKRASRKRLA
jgi:hypothetical protein